MNTKTFLDESLVFMHQKNVEIILLGQSEDRLLYLSVRILSKAFIGEGKK